MFPRFSFDTQTLTVRLILGFLAVIAVTLLAVGLPALILVRSESEDQAQARLVQGASATRALYTARQHTIQASTNLTAERPTLRRLLGQKDSAALSAYLETIRSAAPLDLLVAFDPSSRLFCHAQLPTAWSEENAQELLQPGSPSPGLAQPGSLPKFALLALAPVSDDKGGRLGYIVGGIVVDDHFAQSLREETGLDQSIFVDGTRVATTLPGVATNLDRVADGLTSFENRPFFTRKLDLDPNAVALIALPADQMLGIQMRVVQVLIGSTLLVALLATTLGYLLAQRVTAPLRHLIAASDGIGRGDLDTPIPSPPGVVEVQVLARTLERMRHRLRAAYEDLERSNVWSENLIASLTEGVLTLDTSGRITSFSPGAERILGWRATDVIGRTLSTVFQDGSETAILHTLPGSVMRRTVLTRDRRQITLLITSGAVTRQEDGSSEQALVLHDVTEEEEAMRLREFFLANVSHELKTPLSSLRASIELLATARASLTPAEQFELINSLWLGTIRLQELVDNLLSSASIYSGQFQVKLRPTDLESLVEETMLTTRPLLLLRGQHLELDIPPDLPPVWADPRRLGQVLVNLISNASKYGPTNAPIQIRALLRPRQLVVQVADQGPGIAPGVRDMLFQPFKRSDEMARGGVGLGLSIVRTIIERHGGEVGVMPAPERGSVFWFTLNICENP